MMDYFGEDDFGCRSSCTLPPGCKITCSYSFFIGVSGVASFLSWKPGWEGDNVEIIWGLWDLAGGNGNPDAYRYLADPAVRRQMVPIIQQARD